MSKIEWKLTRQAVPLAYAWRRWDQAFQALLTWSTLSEAEPPNSPGVKEQTNANSSLSKSIDSTPSRNANPRTTVS